MRLTLLGFERGTGGVANSLSLQIELERVVELARAKGRAGDPVLRQAIAGCWERVQVLRCLGLRALSAGASGRPPGPESSILKLFGTEYHQRVTELAVSLLGLDALALTGPGPISTLGAPPVGLEPTSSAAWLADLMHARAGTV